MPAGDGTGPAGMGPMTGRAAGYCAGYGVPGFANPGFGRGFRGRGGGWWGRGGRGRRNWFHATGTPGWARASWGMPAWGAPPVGYASGSFAGAPTSQQELDGLKAQAEHLESVLQDIHQRIEELHAETNDD